MKTKSRPAASIRRWFPVVLVLTAIGRLCASAYGWPANLFAPYVDFTAWPPYDIVGAATNTGLRDVTLAFIVADPSQNPTNTSPTNIPAWAGFTEYSTASGYRLSEITSLRARGGDVIISFGGQAGSELAVYLADTNRLKSAYDFVINTYGATRIDFDIEGVWVADHPSINRRSGVLASLQAEAAAAGRPLEISLTLPVLPSGLDNDGLYVVQSAVNSGVNLACVNIMTMDYGDDAAPDPAGKMGAYALMAATNLFNQLKAVYQTASLAKADAQLWRMVGLTPMLGVNDQADEIFDSSAAGQVAGFAETQSLGMLSFWSLNRDQPGGSDISQAPFQFTEIFLPFAEGAVPPPLISAARDGNDLLLTWKTSGASTNRVQSTDSALSVWRDVSPPIVLSGNESLSTNWTASGALTNQSAAFYRLRAGY